MRPRVECRGLEVHDDEAGAVQMAHNALRCEGGPEDVRVAVALASFEEPQSKGDRLGKGREDRLG